MLTIITIIIETTKYREVPNVIEQGERKNAMKGCEKRRKRRRQSSRVGVTAQSTAAAASRRRHGAPAERGADPSGRPFPCAHPERRAQICAAEPSAPEAAVLPAAQLRRGLRFLFIYIQPRVRETNCKRLVEIFAV